MSAALLSMLFTAAASAASSPQVIPAPVEKVFVPQGFDDNDNAQVIVKGQFINSCFKTGPATANVDLATKIITLEPTAYRYDAGARCAQLVVPYIIPVSLGLLPLGTYNIVVKGQDNVPPTSLKITNALSSTPDDYLYLPVESVGFVARVGTEDTLRIEGAYPLVYVGCMELTEFRTSISPDHVVVVQPIAKIKPDGTCSHKAGAKFALEKNLGEKLPDGEYVLHVRTLDGSALNRFTEVISNP